MIKITKDTLDALTIKTVYAVMPGNRKILTIPVELYAACWRVYIGVDMADSVSATLEILRVDNSIVHIDCTIKKIDKKYKQYIINISSPLPVDIRARIKKLEEKYGAWEKRKGLRLTVGKTNYSLFNLESGKQVIALNGFEYSCDIDDVSMHGIRISFTYPKLQNCLKEELNLIPSIIGLKLAFINPFAVIFLIAEPHRIHSFERERGRISVGCKIKEPINIAYIDRVSEFMKKMERQYVHEQGR